MSAEAPRRRTWIQRSVAVAIGTAVLVAAVLAAVGWYYAGVLEDEAFTVHPRTTAYHYVVLDIDDGRVTIDTARPGTDDRWSTDGTWGIEWDGGHGHLGSILAADLDAGTVTREITIGAATLEPGTRVRIENSVYMGGPADAGLIAEEVWFASPVGEFPAWVVPGDGEAWAILVHGRTSDRRETLRLASILDDVGLTGMSIAYRNEEALPGDPSGRYGYGLTEWEDLEAAVALALEQGAREITLAGFSMGGGVVARFLEQSPLAASVCAVVFDAPMLDFEATVRFQASERGLPGPLVWLGKHAASWWYDVDWNALDYLSRMDDTLQVPTLVLHGLDDDQVPISISRELADRLPGRVTLEEFPGAGHVQAWNVDRQRYEGAVTAFYASGGPAAACAPS